MASFSELSLTESNGLKWLLIENFDAVMNLRTKIFSVVDNGFSKRDNHGLRQPV